MDALLEDWSDNSSEAKEAKGAHLTPHHPDNSAAPGLLRQEAVSVAGMFCDDSGGEKPPDDEMQQSAWLGLHLCPFTSKTGRLTPFIFTILFQRQRK